MKKLTKKEKQIVIDLIRKHMNIISTTYDNKKHWYQLGASSFQIEQLLEALENGYQNFYTFDEFIKINSDFTYIE